jgi:hypothetical protein
MEAAGLSEALVPDYIASHQKGKSSASLFKILYLFL